MRWSEATDVAGNGERPRPGSSGGAPERHSPARPLTGTVRIAAAVALVVACGVAWACARPGAPPGASEETEPPGVRSISPARDTVVPGLSGPVTVRFDEPISAGSGLERQLVASPAYRYAVTVGHSEISVRPEGGWRPGAVYVLELPAGISDLLNNAREQPIRMVFSTGPAIVPTLIRARLFDRITGEERTEGRVLYLRARDDGKGSVASVGDSGAAAEDTVPYTSVADTAGVYVLRHVPPGDYWAYGFVDRNRNLRLDRELEPYDSARVALGFDSAEASVRLFTLEPDSTAPVMGRVETPDSTTLRLEFDDHLRPGRTPERVVVRREGTTDSLPLAGVRVVTAEDTMPPDTAAAPPAPAGDTAAAPADTAAATDSAAAGGTPTDTAAGMDTAAADTAAAGAPAETAGRDTARAGRGITPAGAGAALGDTVEVEMPPRPTRILVVRLRQAMAVGDTYRVGVREVANLWGLTADADTTFVFTPPPDTAAEADTAATDTAAAGARPDSVASDTAAAGAVLREGAPEDSVPADTTGALP